MPRPSAASSVMGTSRDAYLRVQLPRVELFVCGQMLHFKQIDMAMVAKDVQLATGKRCPN